MAQKVTIDDLAGMVKRGFDGVDRRFDKIDEKLDRIENYLLKKHEMEIEKPKSRVKDLEDLFALPARK